MTLAARAGDGGKLFGSVRERRRAAVRTGGPLLDKKNINIAGHIKNVGSHTVTIELHPHVSASVKSPSLLTKHQLKLNS